MDKANHPQHYGGADNSYEVIKVIHAWSLHTSFAIGNAVKYLARAGKKGGEDYLDDLKKARWYLDWEIKRCEPHSPPEVPQRQVPRP